MPIHLRNDNILYRPDEVMPTFIEGYKKHKDQSNLWVPIKPSCIYATEKECGTCGGGKIKMRSYCTLKGKLDFLDCLNCQQREAPK